MSSEFDADAPDEQPQSVVRSAGRLKQQVRKAKRPPPSARCAGCGGDSLSAIPTFSAGSGVAARPFADDVMCHVCGYIGPPALVSS